MAIVKCSNGHYYNNAEYKECPYCSGMVNFDMITIDSCKLSEPLSSDYKDEFGYGITNRFVKCANCKTSYDAARFRVCPDCSSEEQIPDPRELSFGCCLYGCPDAQLQNAAELERKKKVTVKSYE